MLPGLRRPRALTASLQAIYQQGQGAPLTQSVTGQPRTSLAGKKRNETRKLKTPARPAGALREPHLCLGGSLRQAVAVGSHTHGPVRATRRATFDTRRIGQPKNQIGNLVTKLVLDILVRRDLFSACTLVPSGASWLAAVIARAIPARPHRRPLAY
jgi:hypothetical protein